MSTCSVSRPVWARGAAPPARPPRSSPDAHGAPREWPGLLDRGRNPADAKGNRSDCAVPMVAVAAYAPPPRPSDSVTPAPPQRLCHTDYSARLDRARPVPSTSTAPPVASWPSVATASSRRTCRMGEAARPGALLTALPDRMSGYRLAGRAQDNAPGPRARSPNSP